MRHTTLHLAFNKLTNLYWNGKAFTGSRSEAKVVDATTLAVLRYTFQNVSSTTFGIQML